MLPKMELIAIYNCYIRTLLKYCSVVYIGDTISSHSKLNSVQRKAHIIICGGGCKCHNFQDLISRRTKQAIKLFLVIANNSNHILHEYIPIRLPHSNQFSISYAATSRKRQTFLMCVQKRLTLTNCNSLFILSVQGHNVTYLVAFYLLLIF